METPIKSDRLLECLTQGKLSAALLKELHGILLEGEADGNPGIFFPKQN